MISFVVHLFSEMLSNVGIPKIAYFYNHLSTGARRAKRSVIRMLVIVVVLFSFCWLPYHTLVLYDNFAGARDITPVFFQMMMFSLWLSFANSCCNPVVYAVLNRNYRREFGRLLRYVWLETTEETWQKRFACTSQFLRQAINWKTHAGYFVI